MTRWSAALVIAVLAAASAAGDPAREEYDAARGKYAALVREVARAGWQDLAAEFLAVARDHPASDVADDALLDAAYIYHYYVRGAVTPVRELERPPAGPPLRNGGFEDSYGDSYGEGANDARAAALLSDLVERYPEGDRADEALYWLGKVYEQHLRQPENAEAALERLRDRFPRSPWAALAEEEARHGVSPRPSPLHWSFNIAGGAQVQAHVTADQAHSETASLLVVNRSPLAPNVYGRVWQAAKVEPGTEYRLSCWVKGENVGTAGHWTDWKSYQLDVPAGTYDWQRIETKFTTPAKAESIVIGLNVVNVTDALWVDDVALEEVSQ
ncbi:MAG: tetratricopeptide repeat protein [Armatimonadota bacterium]|nr:MAG: tetratricopeptide repeat protein [Armatimonadota bacterium]